jgi:hypothetical protein
MAAVIQVKRGTASSWTSANTILAAGEIGFETDTKKFKVGDGSTAWTSLGYAGMSASSTDTLTNKTISGSSNTLSNIGNSSLTNSSITVNGTSVSLGGSVSVTGESFHPFMLMGS